VRNAVRGGSRAFVRTDFDAVVVDCHLLSFMRPLLPRSAALPPAVSVCLISLAGARTGYLTQLGWLRSGILMEVQPFGVECRHMTNSIPCIFLLLLVHLCTSVSASSALAPPSECDELWLENQRLRALLERLSARSREQPKFEPWVIGRLSEERHAIRGAARALLQAEDAAVVQGEANTNECPIGSAAINGEEECQQAADILGIKLLDSGLHPAFPKACYLYAGYAHFNPHPVGSNDPDARPVCYARTSVPTPAPTRMGDTISPTAAPTMEGAA
jgi:hypothetical protein